MKRLLSLLALPVLALTACAGNPVNAVPVTGFDSEKYLGTWYEIARMDHSFEKGLSNVTANYSKRDDGKITVLNKGYKDKSGKFKDAKGKAKFAVNDTTGHLKVSFFGPFYGDYIIFGMDKINYQHAYVSGGKDNYLWLLARGPRISENIKNDFLAKSSALGYQTDELIWVDHSLNKELP